MKKKLYTFALAGALALVIGGAFTNLTSENQNGGIEPISSNKPGDEVDGYFLASGVIYPGDEVDG